MRRSVHEIIYSRLEKLGVLELASVDHAKSVDPDGVYMDLNYDNLGTRVHNPRRMDSYDISLAHNYIQNGDVMADPDMEIRIYPEAKAAEALTYQQDGLGIFQQVYPAPGKYVPRLKRELNSFLSQWLKNAIQQGHHFNKEKVTT